MGKRTKRLLAVGFIAFGLALPGNAIAGQKHGPGCHGVNQVPCRPDPQPDRGNDCGSNSKHPKNSNDHCGEVIPV